MPVDLGRGRQTLGHAVALRFFRSSASPTPNMTAAPSTTPSGSELSSNSGVEPAHLPRHAHRDQEPDEHGDAADGGGRLGVDAPLVGLDDPAEPQGQQPDEGGEDQRDAGGDAADDQRSRRSPASGEPRRCATDVHRPATHGAPASSARRRARQVGEVARGVRSRADSRRRRRSVRRELRAQGGDLVAHGGQLGVVGRGGAGPGR